MAEEWLKAELQKVLGWDPQIVHGMVEAISKAVATGNKAGIEDYVQNWMCGAAEAPALVEEFVQKQRSSRGQPPAATAAGARGLGPRPAAVDSRNDTTKQQKPAMAAGSVSYTAPRKKGKGKQLLDGAPGQPVLPAAQKLERKVVNCLRCGKVYDCRQMSEEAIAFLGGGGKCLFCGNMVRLRYRDGTAPAAAAAAAEAASDTAALPPEAAAEAEAKQRAAEAFKDRLVGYDRDSAKRTSVIDDQADYFEIDANAWLTAEEREQLKQQQLAVEQAAERRRLQVRYTLDLMGRRVVAADADAPLGFDLQGDAHQPTQPAASAQQQQQQQQQLRAATLQAAAATLHEVPQGGGTAGAAALQALSGTAAIRSLRAVPNPQLSVPAPTYLPSATPRAGAGPRSGTAAPRRSGWSGRIQDDDLFDQFVEEVQVTFSSAEEAEAAAAARIAACAGGPSPSDAAAHAAAPLPV